MKAGILVPTNRQQGFTLIELIVVIVILGILAATAMPKFVNLQADARQAAVKGVASGLTSAGAINYGARMMGASAAAYSSTYSTSYVGVTCQAIATSGMLRVAPAGYNFPVGAKANGVWSCNVVDQAYAAASAVATIPMIP